MPAPRTEHDPLCDRRDKVWLTDREYTIDCDCIAHDPLCDEGRRHRRITFDGTVTEWCDCDLIARVRADERMTLTSARYLEAAKVVIEAEVRERIAQEIEAEWAHFMRVTSTDQHHWLGRVYADAARIARGTP
jgi:hypothetical protein